MTYSRFCREQYFKTSILKKFERAFLNMFFPNYVRDSFGLRNY